MSLLLAEGHASAYGYSIGRVYDESNLVMERQNARMKLETVLAQHAHGAVTSKKGGTALQRLLKKLDFVTKPTKEDDGQATDSEIWD